MNWNQRVNKAKEIMHVRKHEASKVGIKGVPKRGAKKGVNAV
jgi:hypothetical protein